MIVDYIMALVAAIMDTGSLDANSLLFSGTTKSGVKSGAELLKLIDVLWQYLMIVAIGMTLVYFLMEMNEKFALEGRDLNMKSFFLPFLKLMIAIAVLSQGAKLVGLILSINDTLVSWADTNFILTASSSTAEFLKQIKSIVKAQDFIPLVLICIPLTVCWVISMALTLVWWYKAITYKLEVLFRVGISPIALADVYSGHNSVAVKWLKGFLVLGIYAMSMIILPRIAMMMAVVDMSNITDIWGALKAILQCLIVPFAALGCMSLSRQAAKEALGA